MAQQLRAMTILPEDLGLIPSAHVAAHNCLLLNLWPPQAQMVHGHTCEAKHQHTSNQIHFQKKVQKQNTRSQEEKTL